MICSRYSTKHFGIHWDDSDDFSFEDRAVPAITQSLVRGYKEISDQFSGRLEYSPAEGEFEILA
jgi:hypothetical protein